MIDVSLIKYTLNVSQTSLFETDWLKCLRRAYAPRDLYTIKHVYTAVERLKQCLPIEYYNIIRIIVADYNRPTYIILLLLLKQSSEQL